MIIGLQYATSEETLLAEVTRLRDALQSAGCFGVIDQVPYPDDPLGPDLQPVLYSIAVVGSPNLAAASGESMFLTRFDLDDRDVYAITEHGLNWCDVPGGTWTLGIGSYILPLSPDRVGDVVRTLVDNQRAGALRLTCANLPDQARTFSWAGDGRVIYTQINGHGHVPPQQAVDLSVELLTDLAPHLSYGFGVHASGRLMTHGAHAVLTSKNWPWPRVQSNQFKARRLEAAAGWDAFAVIVHGPAFPPVPPEAPYDLADRIGDRTLWVHRDAARWIDGTRTRDPDEVERTRTSLGATLIPLVSLQPG